MADDWPSTDTRRASKLREAIESSASMLAPDWAGLRHEGDFGRALVEIAARLAEHSTSRLDRTALRDKLAFLDALDVATPAPQSAIVPIVFTLAEKRETPVFAPARVKVSAEGEKEEIDFETREAIDLTPARLATLIAADPAADRIECAPAFVIAGLAGAAPATRYMLLSAVESGAGTLQLVQAVGIQPHDLLRLGGTVYRAAKVDGTIVQLRDPVLASEPAGALVERVIALESFDLRDLQDHAAYVGHKELLKLDGLAEIVLVFDPPTLPSQLAALDVEYGMWGTRKDQSDPAWHPLELLGAGREGLRLAKDWEGGVDELEVAGCASRWIRLRLKTPIAGAGGPPTSTVSVKLKVESAAATTEKPEGSRTIAAAFHNSQPLSTGTAFFPFGPEPQRFDVFALAAPEALSKKGATVTLDVTFADASLMTMALADGGPDRVYGVSRNGRLQSIRFGSGGKGRWRQLGLPRAGAGEEPGQGSARLGTAPLYALSGLADPLLDLVVVGGTSQQLHAAKVRTAGNDWAIESWQDLPLPDDEPVEAFCLIPADRNRVHWLIAVDKGGVYGQTIDRGGGLASAWARIAPSGLAPDFGPPVAITPVQSPGPSATIVLIDAGGGIHRGIIAPGLGGIAWTRLANAPPASAEVRPAAFLDEADRLVVLAARKAGDELLVFHEVDGELAIPTDSPGSLIGRPVSIAILPELKRSGSPLPLVAVAGPDGFFVWAAGDAPDVYAFPSGVDPDGPHRLVIRPPAGSDADAPPELLLNAASEILLHAPIKTRWLTLEITGHDWIGRVSSGTPTHVVLDRATARLQPLSGPWLNFSFSEVHPLPAGTLVSPSNVDLVEEIPGTQAGNKAGANKIRLSASDSDTAYGDLLLIGNAMRRVVSIEAGSTSDPADTATLDGPVPGANNAAVSYAVYKHLETWAITATNIGQLLSVGGANVPDWAEELHLPPPAAPSVQRVHLPTAQQGPGWIMVTEYWTTPPAQGSEAAFVGDVELGSWEQVRLPREADNPKLSWEYYDGGGWRRIEPLLDSTANLAQTGEIVFRVPDDLAPTEIAGKEDYWIRARLVGGDYGRPAYVIANDPNPPANVSRTSITIDRSRLNPPEILSIEAIYKLRDAVPPDCVVADNNLAAIDQTQAALADGAVFNLFEGVAQHVGDPDGGTRTLYLGFGRRPGVAALNLYADAVDRDSPPRLLVAEALTRDGWRPISTDDETAALTRPGMLRLYLHPPPEQLPLFGRDGWWFRLRPGADAGDWAPVLRGLFVNAVLAEHAKSVSQEILGSSLGEPGQSYRLAQIPVLPETLELRVLESLGREEQEAFLKRFGKDAIEQENPNLPGQWVLWRRVETFVDEDGDARVYRLDPASGEIRFGNGRNGKVPPAGRDSIRAFSYQKGGGSAGNVGAWAIGNLSSAIESVEQAVNPVDSAGGADAPSIERLAITAPDLLRYAGRALAPPDIEALAIESAPDVARARCLARKGCSITLAVAIRATGVRCPVPSRARREGIARNIVAAGWGALAADSVSVLPPRYVHVTVDAAVIATSAESVAGVDRDIRAALAAYLHPVEGGPDGLGWPFGRRVWPSDLQRAIADVEGLDRVVALDVAARDSNEDLDAMPPDGLICVEEDDIGLVVEPPERRR